MTLKIPANIRDSIIYDPATKEYFIIEKVGSKYFRKPTSLTFEEYMRIQSRKAEQQYFRDRANTASLIKPKVAKAQIKYG